MANLEGAYLCMANLQWAHLYWSNLKGADLEGTNLKGANLKGTDLEGVENLTINQLSKVKTLYNATLGEEILIPLKEKYPVLFRGPEE